MLSSLRNTEPMPSQPAKQRPASCVRVVLLCFITPEITVVLPVTLSYPIFVRFVSDCISYSMAGNHEKKRIAAAGTPPDSINSLSFTANARAKQQAALGQPKLDL